MVLYNISRVHTLRITFEIAVLLLMIIGNSSAATIKVPDDFDSIQIAIDNAANGDIIEVSGGIYFENVNINKQIILRGIETDSGKPSVNAGGNGSAIMLSANGITLEKFSTDNASDYWPDAEIKVLSENNIIVNNSISDQKSIGIYLSSGNNMIKGNTIAAKGGVVLYNSGNNILIDNAVSNANIGIRLYESTNNTISGNTFELNDNYGIGLWDSNQNNLSGNIANSNGKIGIYLQSSSNNILRDNLVSNNEDGIFLQYSCVNKNCSKIDYSSKNTINGNYIMNNMRGIILVSGGNLIYDNYFNNTLNVDGDYMNEWNNTGSSEMNIVGGPIIGGNFWADKNGTGFSQLCNDTDGDSICDEQYRFDDTNIDCLPLSVKYERPLPPVPELPTFILVGLGMLSLLIVSGKK